MQCPKCNFKDLHLFETIEEIEMREVINGVMQKARIDHFAGASLGWRAECQFCKHEWVPRNKTIDAAIDAARGEKKA